MIKKLINLQQHMDICTLILKVIWYQLLCFTPKKIQSMLLDYEVIEMVCFHDYSDAATHTKKNEGKFYY